MPKLRRKAADELSRAVVQLVIAEPFFGHLLANVVRVVRPDSTPTAAVALRERVVTLTVNPQFFVQTIRRKVERVAVVKHEVLHLLFKHLFRRESWHDALLFNVAADLVVNQLIGRWTLPAGAITLETFPDLDLAADQTLEHYYERLVELSRNTAAAPDSASALADLRADPTWHSDHHGWGSAGEADSVERQIAEAEIGQWVEQAAQRAGSAAVARLSEPLRRLVQAWIAERHPQLQWRRVVRMFSASARRSRVLSTLRRPSKRYKTFPGSRVRRMSRLVVAVDTSGSIEDSDLSDFFAEVRGMWRAGAEVTVVECDAVVQRVWRYRGALPDAVGGRGGTNFDPVFRWLRDQRERYDGCIYLTDGYAPAPRIEPPCKLLWVVTARGELGEHLRYGRAVKLAAR